MKKPIMPNKNNKPSLSAVKTTAALASFKNFSKAVKMPPVTANDRTKMQTALVAFKTEIQKTKAAAAKNAVGNTAAAPAVQLAAQQTVIGAQIPSIANYLPPEVNPANVTFAAAIQSMQDTVAQIDILITNPVQGGGTGYLGGKEFVASNVKDF